MSPLSARWVGLVLQVGPLALAAGAATLGGAHWLSTTLPKGMHFPLLLVVALAYLAFLLNRSRSLWGAVCLLFFAGSLGASGVVWVATLRTTAWGRAAAISAMLVLLAFALGRWILSPNLLLWGAAKAALWIYLLGWPVLLITRLGARVLRTWAVCGLSAFVLLAAKKGQDLHPEGPISVPELAGDFYLIGLNMSLALMILLPN